MKKSKKQKKKPTKKKIKKTIKKKIKKKSTHKSKKIVKQIKKAKLRNNTKLKTKKIETKKTAKPKTKKTLNDFLSTPQKVDLSQVDDTTKEYIKLYGAEFEKFNPRVKQFLISNLSLIAQVTQRYLEYPRLAIRLKLHGVNAIEFILHPNGDISDAKLILSSFHEILDDNTIETIKIAYKDYPRPTEPVRVRISVKYIYN
jgi:protein TonB